MTGRDVTNMSLLEKKLKQVFEVGFEPDLCQAEGEQGLMLQEQPLRDLQIHVLEKLLNDDLETCLRVGLGDFLELLVALKDREDVVHEMLQTVLIQEADLRHRVQGEEDPRSHIGQREILVGDDFNLFHGVFGLFDLCSDGSSLLLECLEGRD